MQWNLKDLFKDEKEVNAYLQACQKNSQRFRQDYENKLATLSPSEFQTALKEFEQIAMSVAKIMTYAYLCFAQNTTKGANYAKFEQECKKIEENILFFELELSEFEEKKAQIYIKECQEYGFYIEKLMKNKKHNLSKKEERIMLYLSSTGANAFSRLFDETMSRLKVPFGDKILSEEEILSKLYNAKPKIRQKAAKNFSKVLKNNAPLLTYILNMIKSERKNISLLRGYENAEEPRHISNQISQTSVDSLIATTEKNFHLVSTFYERKRQILGLKSLKDYDRYAPIGKDIKLSYKQAQDIVLKAFGAFSSEFADIAKEAFDKDWIDVYPKEYKQGGAFSHSAVSEAHPYVMLNFTGTRRDLFTLAHELGHAIHQKLSYKVSFLNQDTPLTTAETASVFAEMLVFDYTKNKLKKDELIGLYASKLEDIFATLYRQINFTTFERAIHAYEGELSTEQISQIWLKESKKMFGKSVKLGKDYALWWSYIPHFIHTPFYCYAYAYAQLLVLALYGLYKSAKTKNFKENYLKMLSLGGSKSPKELVGLFGFDIEDKNFWQFGIKEIEKLVGEFLALR